MAIRSLARVLARCAVLLATVATASAFAQAPAIASISPSQGPIAGGTVVTITGSGFTPGTTVAFNRIPASATVVDASHLQVTTPALGTGPFATALAAVRVSNASGTTYAEFLYLPPTFEEIGIGDITTLAGVGNFVGEGRLATQALVDAEAIAIDPAGNVYLGEESGGRVRRIGADGRIVTVAGNGFIGFSGDGGLATDAQFNWPAGVAVDRSGNLYIADYFGNSRIRRVDAATGVVTTLAGTGQPGYSGDGGVATQAQLDRPIAIALDAQANVYFADLRNQRIRKISSAGLITTIAGTGAAGFSGDGGPATQAAFNLLNDQLCGLAVDSRGLVYVIDGNNQRIRRIALDGTVSTVVGGGTRQPSDGAIATQVVSFFNGIALDADDRLMFSAITQVLRLEADGTLKRIAGTGTLGLSPDGGLAVNATMAPECLAGAPNGDLLVSERAARRVRRIAGSTGILSTAAGIGLGVVGDQGEPALAAALDLGTLSLDPAGNVVLAGGLRIRRIDSARRITTVAGIGVAPFASFYREGMQALAAGMAPVNAQTDGAGRIVFTDFCAVRRIGTDGAVRTIVGSLTNNQACGFGGDGGPGSGALLGAEQDVLKLDGQGNIYIADQFNQRVRRLDAATGVITTYAGSGPASDPGGYFPRNTNGFSGDGGPATQALLNFPSDVALDPRRNVCIADTGNGAIRCVDSQGIIQTVAGRGSAYPGDGGPGTAAAFNPYRLAFDPAGGMYIGDIGDATIRKLDTGGTLTTIAGMHHRSGFSGDGGPATLANLDYGYGSSHIADARGNILIFDGNNRRIRVVKQAPTLGPLPSANAPGPLSGLWWNPNESGWGISITQRRNVVFAAWYTYDAAGNPKWYVASSCPMASASTTGSCTGTLFEVNGPRFFGTAFDPAAVRSTNAGTLQLTFTGAGTGSMAYAIGSQSRTVSIARQLFAPGSAAPPVDYTDLWWNPNESGWGISITHQFAVMFLAWYVYDATGKPVWYVASNCSVNAAQNGCSGTLYRTTGPPLGPTFDPSRVQAIEAGAVTVTFTDPNNATLVYTVDGIAASKAITRQLF